jgi:replicative superfamily II helicase
MPLTREERLIIEEVIKRVTRLNTRLNALEQRVGNLETFADDLNTQNILDFTDEELEAFIRNAVRNIISKSSVPIHDHTTDQQGGAAFAQLGAQLIDNV